MTLEKAIYEQAPWDQNHIESLYKNIEGVTVTDGQWHDFPPLSEGEGMYRILGERYFQAIFGDKSSSIFGELMAMSPVNSEDDAEWTVWKREDGYMLASVFSLTPGPFDNTDKVIEWLNRHGLGFEPDTGGMRGVAYFSDLEPGCVLDAIGRLAWLETVVMELNRRLTSLVQSYWGQIKSASDRIYNNWNDSVDQSSEIVPVPEEYKPSGRKRREPASSSAS